jgi:hypothetical protein
MDSHLISSIVVPYTGTPEIMPQMVKDFFTKRKILGCQSRVDGVA